MQNSQTLSNKIRQAGEAVHGQGRSYEDKNERAALRNFLKNCPEFQGFWKSYFGTLPNITLKEDPLGEFGVDLGIVDFEHKIYGLIEVDVFESWGENGYPAHYKKFHVLERKLKYFEDTDYKYLTCTFNKRHNQMCATTRENIEKCHFLYGVTKLWMPKINAYDTVVRCPLDENIFWFGVK
jgi:hypothetical protein